MPKPFEQQQRRAHQFKPAVAQAKNGVSSQSTKQPVAPAVYRPEVKRNAVQPKTSGPSSLRTHPIAPAVYRSQPLPRVLQIKAAGSKRKLGPSQGVNKANAPPVYKPNQIPRILHGARISGQVSRPDQDAVASRQPSSQGRSTWPRTSSVMGIQLSQAPKVVVNQSSASTNVSVVNSTSNSSGSSSSGLSSSTANKTQRSTQSSFKSYSTSDNSKKKDTNENEKKGEKAVSRETQKGYVFVRKSEFTDPNDWGRYLYRAMKASDYEEFLKSNGQLPANKHYGGLSGNPRYASPLIGNKVNDKAELYTHLIEFRIGDKALEDILKLLKNNFKPEGATGDKGKLEALEETYPLNLLDRSIGLGKKGTKGITINDFNKFLLSKVITWRLIKWLETKDGLILKAKPKGQQKKERPPIKK